MVVNLYSQYSPKLVALIDILITPRVMCIGGPRVGKRTSIYQLPEIQKVNLAKKLPQLRENRVMMVTKNILFMHLDNHADNIIANAKIYTMDQKNPIVEAIALKGGQILFAGKMADALIYKGANTRITDLRGRVVIPGFVDPHVHMCFTMFRHWIDLSPFVNKSLEEVKEKIIAQVKQAKQNQWVLSQLYDPTITEGQLDISLKGLDQISQTVPIFILQSNAHVAHVNSAAFKVAGITKQSEDPPYGRFMRDQNGQLTGELQQSAVHVFKQHLFGTGVKYEKNFKQFLHHCASKGCTTLNDCGIGIIDPRSDLSVLFEVMSDDPPVRYSGFLVSTAWDSFMEDKIEPDYKDPFLRIHGIKCWVDGSAQGGSAFMREKYLKEEWGVGKPNYELDDLIKAVKVAHDNGWQVAIHANGDAGIDIALDAFEAVQKQNPKPDIRHRIQHCTVCHKDQLERMKKLNVTPSFLIGHVFYYGQVFRDIVLGQQRIKLLDPMKTAVDIGLRPSMHSDYNCQPVDPIRCIHNAVTRKMRRCGGTLNKQECITPYEAIRAMTIDSAWQCHMDDIVGSLQKGKRADFVVLNEDPMKIPQDQLINLKVVQTWMDGRRTYKSEQLRTLQSLNSTGQIRSISSLRSQQSV